MSNSQNTELVETHKNDGVLCGIFKVNGVLGENAIKLDHFQTEKLADGQYIPDEKVSSFVLLKDVYGEIYRCNITDKYISSHKKLPLYYIIVRYYSKMVLSEIMKIYVYFVIDDSQEIISSEQLMSEKINGRFILETEIDDERMIIDDNFGTYRGDKKTKNKLKKIIKLNSMVDLIKELMEKKDNDKMKQLGDPYSDSKPPKITFSLRNIK